MKAMTRTSFRLPGSLRALLAGGLLAAVAALAACGSGDAASDAMAVLAASQQAAATADAASGATATGAVTTETTTTPASPPVSKFDTAVAVATSRSCLSGGCHETDTALLEEYKQSRMTHVNVKCNACHGTHTAAELGKPKPNLTGYHAASTATGYVVGKDRCLACHEATMGVGSHPSNPKNCTSCHTPHVFGRPAR